MNNTRTFSVLSLMLVLALLLGACGGQATPAVSEPTEAPAAGEATEPPAAGEVTEAPASEDRKTSCRERV